MFVRAASSLTPPVIAEVYIQLQLQLYAALWLTTGRKCARYLKLAHISAALWLKCVIIQPVSGEGVSRGDHLPIVVVKAVVTSVQHAANKLTSTTKSASYISYSYSSHSAAMIFMISLSPSFPLSLCLGSPLRKLANCLCICVVVSQDPLGFITLNFLAKQHAPNEPRHRRGAGKRREREELK